MGPIHYQSALDQLPHPTHSSEKTTSYSSSEIIQYRDSSYIWWVVFFVCIFKAYFIYGFKEQIWYQFQEVLWLHSELFLKHLSPLFSLPPVLQVVLLPKKITEYQQHETKITSQVKNMRRRDDIIAYSK